MIIIAINFIKWRKELWIYYIYQNTLFPVIIKYNKLILIKFYNLKFKNLKIIYQKCCFLEGGFLSISFLVKTMKL